MSLTRQEYNVLIAVAALNAIPGSVSTLNEIYLFLIGADQERFSNAWPCLPQAFGSCRGLAYTEFIDSYGKLIRLRYMNEQFNLGTRILILSELGKRVIWEGEKRASMPFATSKKSIFLRSLAPDQLFFLFCFIEMVHGITDKIVCAFSEKYCSFRLAGNLIKWFWIANADSKPFLRLYIHTNPNVSTLLTSVEFAPNASAYAMQLVKTEVNNFFRSDRDSDAATNQTIASLSYKRFIRSESKIVLADYSKEREIENAILTITENAPYFYNDKTFYSPDGLKHDVQENHKRNFSFPISLWRVLAWSEGNSLLWPIETVLIQDKKKQAYWMVLSVPQHKVICLSCVPVIAKE